MISLLPGDLARVRRLTFLWGDPTSTAAASTVLGRLDPGDAALVLSPDLASVGWFAADALEPVA